MQTFTINNLETPIRLSKWLQHNFNLNYSLIQKLIRKSEIKVNNKKIPQDYKIVNGDIIKIYTKLAKPTYSNIYKPDRALYSKMLEQIKNAIIFKDENIIAVNKPYGVATQRGSKIKISIDDVLDGLQFEAKVKPRLVHRLDKYTTGVLILARNKQVATFLTDLFKKNLVKKQYLAILRGVPQKKTGIINSKISKLGSNNSKQAITKYKTLKSNTRLSLVEFMPITGRTHQIRIHAAEALLCPILGDSKYRSTTKTTAITPKPDKQLYLHSLKITIKDLLGKNYSIKAQSPHYMNFEI